MTPAGPFKSGRPSLSTGLPVPPAALSPERWASDVAQLKSTRLDMLVVGGGVVGAGVALDAVTRGLTVGIIEAQDWASGTSSRSSKLIHGGLRYLQMLDFALVKEALRERSILLRTAPHLVRPIPFLYPLRHRIWERAYVGAGVALYDIMARAYSGKVTVPMHRHLSKRRTLELAPSLRNDKFIGSLKYYDAQVDDARLVLSLIRSAVSHGALAANRVRAVGLLRNGTTVTGVKARAAETGEEFEISAKVVVSATGVWTEDFEHLADLTRGIQLRPSKGIHLVIPRKCIDASAALILQTEKSVLFVLPWHDHWIIGTTDTPWEYDLARPSASSGDIEYLLATLNAVLRTPVRKADIESLFVGLRPLIAGPSDKTTKLSREHAVNQLLPGLVLVSGGKYTTYRVMAKDTVDAAIEHAGLDAQQSSTADFLIAGAEGFSSVWADRHRFATLSKLSDTQMDRLLYRYGTLASEVIAAAANDPAGLSELGGSGGYLRAEAAYAVTAEGARHLDDVLARRTRISIETVDRGLGAAAETAAIMADQLGWDDDTIAREIEAYRASILAELAAEQEAQESAANDAISRTPPLLELP